ncbi:MAG: DUF1554 domain-containing protein [Myxococcales bacterium]|nr:DUF1554 domain-containing protein [Myxococcales bacterium]
MRAVRPVVALLAALSLGGCPTGKSVAYRDSKSEGTIADVRLPPRDGPVFDWRAPEAGDSTVDSLVDLPIPDTTFDAGYSVIKLVATDGASNGNLRGVAGADQICANEAAAASAPGTWRAFISSSTQNARDLVGAPKRSLPVVNGRDEVLFNNYDEVFTRVVWRNNAKMYTFSGRAIDNNGPWFDGDAWHGSRRDGVLWPTYTCSDWTSAANNMVGAAGELDDRDLLRPDLDNCSWTLALVCMRMP